MASAFDVRDRSPRRRGLGGGLAGSSDPPLAQDRLPPRDVAAVRNLLLECRPSSNCGDAGDKKLNELREMYEPYLNGLSMRLLMPLPSWGVGRKFVENWKRSAWGKISSGPAGSGGSTAESSHF
jgi:hypothetical protein